MSKLFLTLPPAVTDPPRAETPVHVGQAQEEQRLLKGCQRGDRAVMQALYLRYARRVRALTARIVGAGDAEELTQEVFIKVFRCIGSFRGESQLGTWIYRLAVNTALTHATRSQGRKRKEAREEVLAHIPAAQVEGDPLLQARLERALLALPAGYRAVLVLHDIEGLQHEEIAQILDVQVGTSKSQLHKARARMRELLNMPEGETR